MSLVTVSDRPDPVELATALLSRLVPEVAVVRALVGRLGLSVEESRKAVLVAQEEDEAWNQSSRKTKRKKLAKFYRSVVSFGLGTVRDQLEAAAKLAELEGVTVSKSSVTVIGTTTKMSDEDRRLALARLRAQYGDEVVEGEVTGERAVG